MVSRNSTIKNFWMIFFGAVALVAIAAAVFVGVYSSQKVAQMRMSVIDDENYYKVSEENGFKRSLYAACDSLKNMDANLGKAAISSSPANQAQMLTNVVIHANQVNQNLANLPLSESNNLEACQKFVNQTQDYSIYLLKKLASGEELTVGERVALSNLDNVASSMYDFLQEYAESDSGMFLTNGNGMFNNGSLSDSLGKVEENTFAYEKLIYDGPFSDSVEEKTLQSGKKISHEEGKNYVASLFGEAQFDSEISNKGVWYSYTLQNGRVLITSDGKVAQYERYLSYGSGKALSHEECIVRAEEFCKKLGYDVKGVWVSKTQEETTYVNCATVIDDTIVYPDIIKVAVDSYSGEISGCEARAYLYNHRDWNVDFGSVEENDAKEALDGGLKVTNVAKALIEKNNQHYLCYEFQCERGGRQYYVYVDSNTGNEVEIFKVIENTEGHTVL